MAWAEPVNTWTQAQRLWAIKTKRSEQKCLIYSIGKLACSPSKKRSRSSVYAHKLTRSVSLNWSIIAEESDVQLCFETLITRYGLNALVQQQHVRMHEHTLSHHGWVPGLRMIEAAFAWWGKAEWCHTWAPVHGTHEVTFWGRSLRVRRWPPDGWTAQRFMDERWLQGSSLWETGGVWPDRWRISPAVFTHTGRRRDHWSVRFVLLCPERSWKGEKEKPQWDERFQGVCRRETSVNIFIYPSFHASDFQAELSEFLHSAFMELNLIEKPTNRWNRKVIFQHKLGERVFRSCIWPPRATEPAKVRPSHCPAGSSSAPWTTLRLTAVRWNAEAPQRCQDLDPGDTTWPKAFGPLNVKQQRVLSEPLLPQPKSSVR